MTFHELFLEGSALLKEAGVEEAGTDAWYLMEKALQINRTDYLLRKQETVPPEAETYYRELIGKRRQRIPLQHISGFQEFMGFPIRVTGDVLIPRQETELLTEEALHILKRKADGITVSGEKAGNTSVSALDLCTGSGCIAVSLALLEKRCRVTASDLSGAALRIAENNAQALGAEVSFLQSDLFEKISGEYDVIVSNPPYIPHREIDGLQPEVRLFDPLQALDGGEDGLAFYRRIIPDSLPFLKTDGFLLLEIGADQGKPVTELMRRAGFDNICLKKDLNGRERIVSGQITERMRSVS